MPSLPWRGLSGRGLDLHSRMTHLVVLHAYSLNINLYRASFGHLAACRLSTSGLQAGLTRTKQISCHKPRAKCSQASPFTLLAASRKCWTCATPSLILGCARGCGTASRAAHGTHRARAAPASGSMKLAARHHRADYHSARPCARLKPPSLPRLEVTIFRACRADSMTDD